MDGALALVVAVTWLVAAVAVAVLVSLLLQGARQGSERQRRSLGRADRRRAETRADGAVLTSLHRSRRVTPDRRRGERRRDPERWPANLPPSRRTGTDRRTGERRRVGPPSS